MAAELVERAIAIDPDFEDAIGAEVDGALEQLTIATSSVSLEAFLREAHRRLPEALAAQVDAALTDAPLRGGSAVGWSPRAE